MQLTHYATDAHGVTGHFVRDQNSDLGGSDPTVDGLQPPKPKWGRSRPSRRKRDRVLAACIQRCNRPGYGAEIILNDERRESRWQY